MRPRNDLLLGQIALELGMITPEQLQVVLEEWMHHEDPAPIGERFVEKGFLTAPNLVRLVEEQQRRLEEPAVYADVRKKDVLFGEMLIRDGLVSADAVHEAVRIQQELAEEGNVKRLGEILEESGVLESDEVRKTLARQGKTLMACPGCRARFNIVGSMAGKTHRCRHCGRTLVQAGDSLSADETEEIQVGGARDLSDSVEESLRDPEGRVGKYAIVRHLDDAETTFKAYDDEVGRHVLLRFLARWSEQAESHLAAAATLAHPHVVPVHAVGREGDRHYVVEEYVYGKTLDRVQVDPHRTVALLADAAEALDYAHARDLAHGRLSARNLILGDDGNVWIMDFGRPVEGSSVRGDIASLGRLIRELFAPPLPAELSAIAAKALGKRPYETAGELAEDLRRHQKGEIPEAAKEREKRWVAFWAIVVVALALVGLGIAALVSL